MRILGVDPGSIATGFGVVEERRGVIALVEQGCIRTRRGAPLPERLQQIFETLREVIRRTVPDAVAVETPFSGLNPKSLIQLSQTRGVILLAAACEGVSIFEYAPRAVKNAVVGYGGAEKQQVGKMVRLLVKGAGAEKITLDAADALAVAVCHAHQYRFHARIARTG